MTLDREEEDHELLAEQRLGRSGLLVQIDRGFKEGTYGVYVRYDALADQAGFAAARRKAGEYCALHKEQLGRSEDFDVGRIQDASRDGGRGRRRDLEATFLAFRLTAADGRFHDEDMREKFRVALLRAGQASEQDEARAQTDRRDRRQEEFRGKLASLLEGAAYEQLENDTRQRLLDEVPGLVFPVPGMER